MFAFFSLLFYASSLLPFFPFFLSFLPPTYLPSTHTIPYHARFTPYYAMLYYCILCNIIRTYLCPIYIHDLGFILHSLLLFAHTLSIFISLSCHCHSLYTIYIYMVMNRLGVTGILPGGILQRTWEHLICLRSLC